MLIDTHCHVQHRRFGELEGKETARTTGDILRDAKLAGVGQLITIACEREQWAPALALAEAERAVYVGAGIHPQDVEEGALITPAELARLAGHPKVVGLGETGLDYYYENAPRKAQAESFHVHLEAARVSGLPVIVHTREAEEDTLAILREHPGVEFVLHCFTGTEMLARAGVELGGYVSFSGVLTFKKNEELRRIAGLLPRERVLVETDAPYLAPEPLRGKRCEPAMVAHTAACLAKVWGVDTRDVESVTTANAQRLFKRLGVV